MCQNIRVIRARQLFALWLMKGDQFAEATKLALAATHTKTPSGADIQLLSNVLTVAASRGLRFRDAEEHGLTNYWRSMLIMLLFYSKWPHYGICRANPKVLSDFTDRQLSLPPLMRLHATILRFFYWNGPVPRLKVCWKSRRQFG